VIDFSSAERNRFLQAYIDLHLQSKNKTCSHNELQSAATCCLKGCQEHFWAAVVRFAQKHANINPDDAKAFKRTIFVLLALDRVQDLRKAVSVIYGCFPGCRTWLDWWLNNAQAHMLFKAVTDMPPGTWDIAPHTTNVQESHHQYLF
ncbi:hypothetical protein BDV98DRAFT_495512, partial [Pterulicium gracile]